MVLNYDNSEKRRMAEHCIRTGKALLNPIIDWEDEDVWEFLNMYGIEHCCLYDEGFKRLGCIGCPMGRKQKREFERWPKYKGFYEKAFARMLENRKKKGMDCEQWKTVQDVFDWWLDG